MDRLGSHTSLETRHERARGITWSQAGDNKINRNRGPESHQIEANTASQVLHLDTPSSCVWASINKCWPYLRLSFLRTVRLAARVTPCYVEDGKVEASEDAPTPRRHQAAGLRLRATTSASGKSNGAGEAYALLASGQPVKLRVLYSYQVAPKTSGMLGSCSTMICCKPLRACCCNEVSV